MELVVVNVSELAPPEPMTVILTALARLKLGYCLLVTHRRQPFPLYEKLAQAGWAYHCQVHDDDHISLFIYRQAEQLLFEQAFDGQMFQSN
ncbi:DUF2249 domain-containing protein [Colwellia sp. 12G3]|uniref:DUF2249 domain-containing protein n=1 Tax=Colwellia sp. 12G3 TaxID=2058299 RepID=UPI000C32754F|nr:DUF2249 domain-containing protein [Colwellia sp. 12G3]PKI13916.1 hypothetical protein CXF71_15105 [Colwellia sp. 12G3]